MPENYYLQFLNQELERRAMKNPYYSLRSYARDLGVSVSWLSEVLSRKKGMSGKKAESLATVLQLSHQDRQYFILSAQAYHSRSESSRESAKAALTSIQKSEWNSKKMTSDDFHPISDWYYNAILELLELNDSQHTAEWIGKRLNLQIVQAQEALDMLVSQKIIEKIDDKYRILVQETETTFNVPSDAIKHHHRQMLGKAGDALLQQSVLHREFLNMTLSFDSTRLEEAQREIRHFQRQFADKFYSQQSSKDSVYQFSLQFFRLDHQKDAHE